MEPMEAILNLLILIIGRTVEIKRMVGQKAEMEEVEEERHYIMVKK